MTIVYSYPVIALKCIIAESRNVCPLLIVKGCSARAVKLLLCCWVRCGLCFIMSSVHHRTALIIYSVLIIMINVSEFSSRTAAEREVYFCISPLPSVTYMPAGPHFLFSHRCTPPHTHTHPCVCVCVDFHKTLPTLSQTYPSQLNICPQPTPQPHPKSS